MVFTFTNSKEKVIEQKTNKQFSIILYLAYIIQYTYYFTSEERMF